MKKFEIKRSVTVLMLVFAMMTASLSLGLEAYAAPSPASYTATQDVYYTKAGCIVYSQPSYTSPVLVTLEANLPVQVIGEFSNGWFRINIGVIGYVKRDAVTTAGAIGLPVKTDTQILDAQRIAAEIGYEFVYLKLNNEKKIKKDVYNSYVGQKVMLYAKINNEIGVLFKMLYDNEITSDIDLSFVPGSPTMISNPPGGRIYEIKFNTFMDLEGQIAIFQFKEGYDMAVHVNTTDLNFPGAGINPFTMQKNPYCTEFSEFAYAPMTQIANMRVDASETNASLTEKQRERMRNIQRGIKYMSYDNQLYINSIHKQIRKDTEYVDYEWE